jgi:uncharacterized protein (TIGR02444 family)
MPSDLWSFASCCYARPGVEAACLRLQAAGADVCLLLCGLWLEQHGVPCNDERLAALRALSEPWQRQVVQPLRELRQSWRATAATDEVQQRLRAQVKALELEAERELLARLEAEVNGWPHAERHGAVEWLDALAGSAAECRDALQVLRAATAQT